MGDDPPEIYNLKWLDKEGSEIKKAYVGDKVTLSCDCRNMKNSKYLRFCIFEKDFNGEHDYVVNLGSKEHDDDRHCEMTWTVKYMDDRDDCAWLNKQDERGMMPEYIFLADAPNPNDTSKLVKSEFSAVLEIVD